jgi:hypothetical protein
MACSNLRSIGFSLSGKVVVWEQDDKIWDGEGVGSPYPLGVLPPNMALDWELDSVGTRIRLWQFWMHLKRTFFGKLRLRARRAKVGGRF